MKIYLIKSLCTAFASVFLFEPATFAQDAKALVEKMVEASGGRSNLYAQKDVQYEYTYHDLTEDKKDVSIERYVFNGELSWAKFITREKSAAPDLKGELVQGFNGKEAWTTINGKPVDDKKLNTMSRFLRKTNFYWFTMMFKLLDPGLNYEYAGVRTLNGNSYDLVKVTFGKNVGDAEDVFILYINQETNLVDQFLFTVKFFNRIDPLLMTVEYEEINGLKIPTKRKYVEADWEGNPKNDRWIAEISENVKFNNGFDRSLFNLPK